MSVPVPCEQVAALLGWGVHLPAKQWIVEDLVPVFELHTNSAILPRIELPFTTTPIVTLAADVLS